MQSTPVSRLSPSHRRSLSEARDLVAAWRASTQSRLAWCRAQGIRITTLQSYVSRIRRADREVGVPGFIEVRPPAMAASGEVRIELGGGMQVLGLDLAQVVQVLRELREERS